MLSFGIFSARAAMMAARNRAFIVGSGNPSLAATVISRASLPNSFDLAASWRPLRCMMFLNWECPAIVLSAAQAPRALLSGACPGLARPGQARGAARADRSKGVRFIYSVAPRREASPERRPRLLEPPAEADWADMAGKPGGVVGLDRDRAQRCRSRGRLEPAGRDAAPEPVERLVLAHADHRVVVAGHADIRDERRTARQDLMVGRRRVGMGADHEARATVTEVTHRLFLAGGLAMHVDHDCVSVAAQDAGVE